MESLNEVVFVLGGPGSGKGTVCSQIQKEFDYVHLSAGDLLRVEKEGSGETSEMINKILLDGGIVPAEITVGLLGKAMQSSGSKKFLIDGFPRNHDNLLVWYDLMSETSTVSFVLNMDLSEEDMLKRLLERSKSSGRSDDNEETIKKRFKTFYQDTMPVLDMYSMAGKLRTISSAPPPAVVYHETSKLFRSLKILAPFQRTFALIKPDAVANNSVPDILNAIAEASLSVVVMKVITMSSQAMSQFYKEHEGKNFFPELKEFMTSGPAIALVLEGTGELTFVSMCICN
jgi:UMP-CMP kinase